MTKIVEHYIKEEQDPDMPTADRLPPISHEHSSKLYKYYKSITLKPNYLNEDFQQNMEIREFFFKIKKRYDLRKRGRKFRAKKRAQERLARRQLAENKALLAGKADASEQQNESPMPLNQSSNSEDMSDIWLDNEPHLENVIITETD